MPDATPFSPQELDALKVQASEKRLMFGALTVQRLIDTVHERERQWADTNADWQRIVEDRERERDHEAEQRRGSIEQAQSLKAERDELKDALMESSADLVRQIHELQRQLAVARKDTDRMDWLEAWLQKGEDFAKINFWVNRKLEKLRQAIDALRIAQEQPID